MLRPHSSIHHQWALVLTQDFSCPASKSPSLTGIDHPTTWVRLTLEWAWDPPRWVIQPHLVQLLDWSSHSWDLCLTKFVYLQLRIFWMTFDWVTQVSTLLNPEVKLLATKAKYPQLGLSSKWNLCKRLSAGSTTAMAPPSCHLFLPSSGSPWWRMRLMMISSKNSWVDRLFKFTNRQGLLLQTRLP